MKKIIAAIFIFQTVVAFSQSEGKTIREIYDNALSNAKCYGWLDDLSNKIGARLSGSAAAEKAVAYTKKQLGTLGLDRVYLQESWCRIGCVAKRKPPI